MTEAERVRHAADKLADVLTGNVPLKPRPQPAKAENPKSAFPARALRQNWTFPTD